MNTKSITRREALKIGKRPPECLQVTAGPARNRDSYAEVRQRNGESSAAASVVTEPSQRGQGETRNSFRLTNTRRGFLRESVR
jgi:hypothetical protein